MILYAIYALCTAPKFIFHYYNEHNNLKESCIAFKKCIYSNIYTKLQVVSLMNCLGGGGECQGGKGPRPL